jgi:hypothetical protein
MVLTLLTPFTATARTSLALQKKERAERVVKFGIDQKGPSQLAGKVERNVVTLRSGPIEIAGGNFDFKRRTIFLRIR